MGVSSNIFEIYEREKARAKRVCVCAPMSEILKKKRKNHNIESHKNYLTKILRGNETAAAYRIIFSEIYLAYS